MKPTTLTLSVALATFALLCPGFAHASSAANVKGSVSITASSPAQQEALRMVPAQANLLGSLDARKVKSGQSFRAELSGTIHLKNGPELPRGTRLLGAVSIDRMQADGTSRLALRITRAQLKDGKIIPIKATIVGYFPASSFSAFGNGDSNNNVWTNSTLQVDQIGAISGVDLHSKIASHNSGVFVSTKKDNMKLSAGSQFALAIAPRNS